MIFWLELLWEYVLFFAVWGFGWFVARIEEEREKENGAE